MSNDNIRRYVLVIVAIAALIGIGQLFYQYTPKESTQTQTTTPTPSVSGVKTISFDGVDGQTAYSLLKQNHKVEAQQTSVGVFVTGIDGVNNTESMFWMYYVNGAPGTVASDQYQTKKGEKIEWRFEKFE